MISLICFRVYLEVYVVKNPTCFSRWSVRNEEFGEIRIIEKDGEPWFIGKELVDNLGYIKGYSDVIKQQCEVDDYILVDRTQHLTGVEKEEI